MHEEFDGGDIVADEAEEVEEDRVDGTGAVESDGDEVEDDFSDEDVRAIEDGVDGGVGAPRELVSARGAVLPGLGDDAVGFGHEADATLCEGVVAERRAWAAGRRLVPSRFRGIYEEFEAEGRWRARRGRARREQRRRRVRGVVAFHIEEEEEVVFSDAE
ncbi:hypothetical protein AAVH_28575 [Aphelenchoides avenae]|nr:hypothetical protein AAVH_28575 [Aphelenchus avenae]